MPRVLPSVDLMLVTLYRAELDLQEGQVQNIRPDDFLHHLPMVTARRILGGGPGQNWRLADRALVTVGVWAADRVAADELAEQCLVILCRAADRQTVIGGLGTFSRVEVDSAPGEVRDADQPGRLYHFPATYTLRVRPAI